MSPPSGLWELMQLNGRCKEPWWSNLDRQKAVSGPISVGVLILLSTKNTSLH